MRWLQLSRVAVLPLCLLAFAAASCRDFSPHDAATPIVTLTPQKAPLKDTIFTSTREVRALQWDGKILWAATAGGVLRFKDGIWTKWTRENGLPSHEAIGFEGKNVRFPVSQAVFENGKWQAQAQPEFQQRPLAVGWNGQQVTASVDELVIGKKRFALPPTANGTHISALLPQVKTLLVGIFGDGLWRFDGKNWRREAGVPAEAREVLSLAGDRTTLWVGTRREGLFRRQVGKWQPFLPKDEPFAHNIQVLGKFHRVVFGSTLDDGLVLRTGDGWKHLTTPQISSSAPRQMREWRNRFYVRHGNGVVDAFDGARWEKNALATLPRQGVYALGGDESRLIAAGWGGWSEWDGQNWVSHYDIAELKDAPIMNVAVQGDDVWIGTQSRGIGKWIRKTGEFRFYDERDGLDDDWITSVVVQNGQVWAGTFVGGLTRFDGEKWQQVEATKGQNVTALVSDGEQGVYAATRRGLWHVQNEKAEKMKFDWLDEEMQALVPDEGGLWVGTRTSLNFLRTEQTPAPTLKQTEAAL